MTTGFFLTAGCLTISAVYAVLMIRDRHASRRTIPVQSRSDRVLADLEALWLLDARVPAHETSR